MKLSKRILAGIMTTAMLIGAPANICIAAELENPSKTIVVKPAGDSEGIYRAEEKIEETPAFKVLEEEAPEIVSIITEVNEGIKVVDDFVQFMKDTLDEMMKDEVLAANEEAVKSVETVIKEMEEKELDFVTPFFDLDWEENAVKEKNENDKYDVSLEIPVLTEEMKDINLLHYSMERGFWEIIEPKEIDPETKVVTLEMEDFSPVAIVANLNDVEIDAELAAAAEAEK